MFLSFLTLLSCLSFMVDAGELESRLYEKLDYGYMCFRRFNATHEFGCASPMSGSSGALERVDSMADLRNFIRSDQRTPIVLVIPDLLLTSEAITLLKSVPSGRVAGIIATFNASASYPNDLSFDSTCPNNRASLYGLDGQAKACDSKVPWNPPGSGTIFESIPFPVFLLTNVTEIQRIYNCLALYPTNSWPRCSAKLDSFMQGAGSTDLCLRRQYSDAKSILKALTASAGLDTCDIVHGANLLGSSSEPSFYPTERQNNSVLLVVTRSDALSMISQKTPSASYVATSHAAIASSLYILQNFSDALSRNSSKEIVLAALDGEALDYVGSSMLAQSLGDGIFLAGRLLKAQHLFGIIELGELGKMTTSTPVFLHLGPKTAFSDGLVKLLSDSLTKAGVTVKQANTASLPPSSLHGLARRLPQDIPSVLLTDFETQFATPFFHSHRDTLEAMGDQANQLLKPLRLISSGLATAFCSHLNDQGTEDCSLIPSKVQDKVETVGAVVRDFFQCFAGNCSKVLAQNESVLVGYLPSNTVSSSSNVYSSGFNPEKVPFSFDYYMLTSQSVQWPPSYNNSRYSTAFLGLILHATLGKVNSSLNSTFEDCAKVFKTLNFNGAAAYPISSQKTCIYSSVWLQRANSPLFSRLYDKEQPPSLDEMLQSQDSTWAESYWPNQAGQLTLFLMSDPAGDTALLVIGIISTVACLAVALLLLRLQKLADYEREEQQQNQLSALSNSNPTEF